MNDCIVYRCEDFQCSVYAIAIAWIIYGYGYYLKNTKKDERINHRKQQRYAIGEQLSVNH